MSQIIEFSALSGLIREGHSKWWLELFQSIQNDDKTIVILDDDPTGNQTVSDVPILTCWDIESFCTEFENRTPAVFVLTNSRSLTREDASALYREVGSTIQAAAVRTGRRVEILSRSDSTLRGHFPAETEAILSAADTQVATVLIPAFFEGGRYTFDDVHYVKTENLLVPAAQTPYAADKAFGFRTSNLKEYVEEKTGGGIPRAQVISIGISDLRAETLDNALQKLLLADAEHPVVVNAICYQDLEAFAAALLLAERSGKRFLCRTAASFVPVRCGIERRPLLEVSELGLVSGSGALLVAGSYVPKTSLQLSHLQENSDAEAIEVDVNALLDRDKAFHEVRRVANRTNEMLSRGRDVLVYTSRILVSGQEVHQSLNIGNCISDGLVEIVKKITVAPRYLLAKGGITSNDLAVKALEMKRPIVRGQLLPGIPVWSSDEASRFPGMPYIVFPGNVGETNSLTMIYQIMKNTWA